VVKIPIWDGEWWRCIPFTIFNDEGIPTSFICVPTWIVGVVFIIAVIMFTGLAAGDSGTGGGKSG